MRCTVRRVPPRCRLPPAAVHAAAGPNCAQCGQDQEIVAHSDSPDATPDKFHKIYYLYFLPYERRHSPHRSTQDTTHETTCAHQ